MAQVVAKIPLAAGQASGLDPTSAATRQVMNWLVDGAGANRVRPGLVDTASTGLGSAPLIGAYEWRDWVVLVDADRKLYAMPASSPYTTSPLSSSTATTMLDGGGRPVFAEDGQRLVIAGGGALQQWTGVGLTSRLTSSVLFASHVCFLNQYLVANEGSQLGAYRWSDQGDGAHTSWPAINFATAEANPDALVAVHASLRRLYLFGAKTLQVHGVSDDPDLPFQPINSEERGTAAAYSHIALPGEAFAWLTSGEREFVIGNGLGSSETISDSIATDLKGLSVIDDAWGFRHEQGPWKLLVWVFPTAKRAFAYDYARKQWYEESQLDANGLWSGLGIGCYANWTRKNVHLAGSSSSGLLFRFDETMTTDAGSPLVAARVTGRLNHGNKGRKRCLRWRLTMRRGTGVLGATQKQFLELRKRDDGAAWSTWSYVDVGAPGDADNTRDVFPGGIYIDREYEIRYSGSDPTSLLDFEEWFEPLEG